MRLVRDSNQLKHQLNEESKSWYNERERRGGIIVIMIIIFFKHTLLIHVFLK